MKATFLHQLFLSFLMVAFFTACNTAPDKSENTTSIAKAELVLNIEGMTCEMGCKKAIEKVLSNTEGIASGKVVFEEAKAYVAFDPAVVDENGIIATINESYNGAYKAEKAVE
jgi:copper chaperone CopZ